MKFQLFIIICVYILLLANPYVAENAPDEGPKVPNVQLQSSTETILVEEHLGFVQAFLKTLSVIFVSEIGDKTFFIAAIMAMKHPRVMVFLGAMSALAFMTVISVLGGWAMSVIPKKYTYYGSVILFFLFGIKMIFDGMKMKPNEGQEEYEEVQAELRKKEEERAKKAKRKTKKEAVSPTIEAEIPVLQVLPVATEVTENSTMINERNGNEIIVTKPGQEEGKTIGLTQFEKETLTKDVEAGRVDRNSKATIFRVLSHIVVQAFTLTFVAEWGDRSQLATFLLAAKDNKFGITLGGIVGHSICTGIAVTGGRFVAQKISVKTVGASVIKTHLKNFTCLRIIKQPIFMDMIDLNLEHREVKVCPEDLMEAQTLIVEEDCSLGSVDEQNISDLSSAETLLDSTSTNADDDVDLPYQFRSNEGVTYRVVQVSGAITPDSDTPTLSQIISTSPTLTTTQQLQTVFTNPLNGQLYVIGAADEVYPKANSHRKPIAPRTESVVESVRSAGISRDDRRRATHNEVERRRRDKINNWILKLSKIVPECHSDSSKGFDVQPSKGGILAKTCDYILELTESNQKLTNVFKDNERLIAEVSKQKAMNERLLLENTELKNILKQNGLTLSSSLKSEL